MPPGPSAAATIPSARQQQHQGQVRPAAAERGRERHQRHTGREPGDEYARPPSTTALRTRRESATASSAASQPQPAAATTASAGLQRAAERADPQPRHEHGDSGGERRTGSTNGSRVPAIRRHSDRAERAAATSVASGERGQVDLVLLARDRPYRADDAEHQRRQRPGSARRRGRSAAATSVASRIAGVPASTALIHTADGQPDAGERQALDHADLLDHPRHGLDDTGGERRSTRRGAPRRRSRPPGLDGGTTGRRCETGHAGTASMLPMRQTVRRDAGLCATSGRKRIASMRAT